MEAIWGATVRHGEHRRNIVIRGIPESELRGRVFEIGTALLE
ncbi:MAG TPA: hypothetical protein VIT91_00510 [Chthoniobacterales bacterium]